MIPEMSGEDGMYIAADTQDDRDQDQSLYQEEEDHDNPDPFKPFKHFVVHISAN